MDNERLALDIEHWLVETAQRDDDQTMVEHPQWRAFEHRQWSDASDSPAASHAISEPAGSLEGGWQSPPACYI